MRPRLLATWLGVLLVAPVLTWLGVIAFERGIGTDLSVRYGGQVWIPIDAGTPWLAKSVRLALSRTPPNATPGGMTWRTIAPGFEVAELPVLAGGGEVDRILLARIDPARYHFVVRNDPAGRHNLQRWMHDLHPALAVNGSFYGRDGRPATPAVSDGMPIGPAAYTARQGAFVSSPAMTAIHDLAHEDWRESFKGADAAMVSYPLLLAADGSSRVGADSGWLANRSFIGQDREGRIIIGTTKGAFFSLKRLADFLKRTPLDLKLALDLDGGPVACQGVDLNGFRRTTCGHWEIQVDRDGRAKMLPTSPIGQPSMPMVLAVYPR